MIQLGQAAGTAAALAAEGGICAASVSVGELRARLGEQHVQLEWPLTDELRGHILDEGAP